MFINKGVLTPTTKNNRRNPETQINSRELTKPFEMDTEIYNQITNVPNAGHFGIKATIDKMRKRYFWPTMDIDVKNYIESCNVSQIIRPRINGYPDPTTNDWDELIPLALFTYRTIRNRTIKYEPFYLLYSCVLTLPIELDIITWPATEINERQYKNLINRRISEIVGVFADNKIKVSKNIKDVQAIRIVQARQKRAYDKRTLLENGSYILKTNNREVLNHRPVHRNRLRSYKQRINRLREELLEMTNSIQLVLDNTGVYLITEGYAINLGGPMSNEVMQRENNMLLPYALNTIIAPEETHDLTEAVFDYDIAGLFSIATNSDNPNGQQGQWDMGHWDIARVFLPEQITDIPNSAKVKISRTSSRNAVTKESPTANERFIGYECGVARASP
ncbi:hypothetical protein Glove_320g7 [Diversispora epigaea]|uniref:Integrase zinc-binding domain-containing protein n=1 Tax=Diversispora epigaea TaxID=1348612 RepID=A0A397HNV8_9GLOM|nr:hypothetical protein Glove_320g7 [Diversispora epigaea]